MEKIDHKAKALNASDENFLSGLNAKMFGANQALAYNFA